MFTLEDVLLETQVISNRYELDWPTVEYYKDFVIRKYPDFQCDQYDQKAFISFKKYYKKRRSKFLNRRWPVYLDPLKDLLRLAAEQKVAPEAEYSMVVDQPPLWYELQQVKKKVSVLQKEVSDLKKQVQEVSDLKNEVSVLRSELQHRPDGGADHTRMGFDGDLTQDAARASHQDYKLIVQSVTSKHSFIRARQRVALCILYISGLNITKLLSLTVADLCQIPIFVDGNATPTFMEDMLLLPPSEASDLLEDLQEEIDILIDDCPDDAPAFRNVKSSQPCRPDVFTHSLNQILEPWKLSTKSFRTLVVDRRVRRLARSTPNVEK